MWRVTFIDDLGMRKLSLTAAEELLEIISKRQSRKHKLDMRGILLTTDAERPRQLG